MQKDPPIYWKSIPWSTYIYISIPLIKKQHVHDFTQKEPHFETTETKYRAYTDKDFHSIVLTRSYASKLTLNFTQINQLLTIKENIIPNYQPRTHKS